MKHSTERLTQQAFVVTRTRQSQTPLEPLFVSLHFREARSYVIAYNEETKTGKACIRPAKAEVTYHTNRQVSLKR